MTLIAATLNYKKPIIISDLLWSSEDSNGPIYLPTNSFDLSSHVPSGQQVKPQRLNQKMYFIKGKTCIVFAGLNSEILVFLTVFRNFFQKYDMISMNNIHEFLKGYDLNINFLDSAFLITHVDHLNENSIQVGQFYCPGETHTVDSTTFNIKEGAWNVMNHPIYDKVSACGTGTQGFLNLINQRVKLTSRFSDADFMKAIQTNTALIDQILAKERQSTYTIKDNWGGGFEMAYYNGEKFEKLDEIAFIISHAQFDENGDVGLPIPILIMYYKYINNILYILSLEVYKYSIEESSLHTIFSAKYGDYKQTVFEVEGIDVENILEFELPTDYSFTTDKIAMGYSVVTKGNIHFNPAFFNLGPEVQVIFRQKNSVKILIDKNINNDIRSACKTIFPNLQ